MKSIQSDIFAPKVPKREKCLRGMIKGLEKYINSPRYKGTDRPLEIKFELEKRLAELEEENA